MTRTHKKIVGITLGDPAGIGPEITLMMAAAMKKDLGNLLVIGNEEVLERTARTMHSRIKLNRLDASEDIPSVFRKDALNYIHVDSDSSGTCGCKPGSPDSRSALLSYHFILKGIALGTSGAIAALVTNPVSKRHIADAGIKGFSGHTELLAEKTGTKRFNMVFSTPKGIMGLVTTHISIRKVPSQVQKQRIIRIIENIRENCSGLLKGRAQRFAVLGLNPHCGENGLFGNEESREIIPAMEHVRQDGIDISGPFPSDAFWSRIYDPSRFNVVIAMYHDQGLIPVKSGLMGPAVNCTIGLPFLRTSVDHGTAYDIAGKGTADPSGLIRAVATAVSSVRGK
jgi:4-phospho-D-threonate 3-dehydrogenase / 4-phospho-D-erythronate 3-dehydrogenase